MSTKYAYLYLQQTLIFPLIRYVTVSVKYLAGWHNRLSLNTNKTYFIIIGISRECSKLTCFCATPILYHSITPSHTTCNIGVTFDSDFNFRKHISLTDRCCFYNIRDLRPISSYISLSVAKNHRYITYYQEA